MHDAAANTWGLLKIEYEPLDLLSKDRISCRENVIFLPYGVVDAAYGPS